jgi:hypothetical protein
MTYVKFAMNCAQSILLHNDMPVYIVTDLDYPIPEKYKDKVFIIPAKPEHLPLGIAIKLHTDEYLQTEHTLFIDSDCICYGDLTPIFEAAKGSDISVAGNIVPTANWCGPTQAKTIKQEFDIDQIIRFNGGLYYFRKSALTKKIFDQARKIAEKYDDYGFDRIKNKWINEEGPLSIAMMMNGQKPFADDGRFITDLYTDHRPSKINVLSGKRLLKNKPEQHNKHRSWYPREYSPLLLHFGGNNINSYPYNSQARLLKWNRMGFSAFLSSSLVSIFTHFPYRSFHWLRSLGKKD